MTDEITIYKLREWLESGKKVEILDIRPQADYQAWHIPGSRNLDVYHALHAGRPGSLAEYEAPAETPVVAVCFVGQTSRAAVGYLRSRGIPALSLAGGMQAWSLAWNTAEVPLPDGSARVLQVRRTGKGCLSYLVGSAGEALVIDPSVDPQVYLDLAGEQGWRITHVLETHIHADHLSRARVLAERAGARLFLPEQERTSYDHEAICPGETLTVGEVRIQALATPGHTFESLSYYLDEKALFTGDTLFLDSVGRPDLKADPQEAVERSHALWRSLQALTALPPETLVLPCHTGKPVPFDRTPLAATLQEAVARIPAMAFGEDEFVGWVLGRIPPQPSNYEFIVRLNEAGVFSPGAAEQFEAGANHCAI